ncbi:dTMP kinase [Gracilibacillus ureilyticus]|uniref:Thymidylate kinase n=1 Tax=Gracilibacillus ureilyticus TaxID=531814 RepID=A0A1H9VNX5_9BACI|nr:dTMP kinase [Gracilibacillus ureilyticus]SES23259.1 dTMP kinase [Gracilibacillus ureilyticus]
MSGLFITFEGGEGAGKTTVILELARLLEAEGHNIVVTREPGGIPIAEKIREIILDKSHTEMDARTEALLYAAARRQHLVETVIPAVNEGKIVLCDRFIDSSLAYQGVARGLGMDEVYQINKFAIDEYMPDLTLLLDITPEKGIARINGNKEREINRLDVEELSFHHKVYEAYHNLLEKFPDRIKKIDASFDILTVEKEAYDTINEFIKRR